MYNSLELRLWAGSAQCSHGAPRPVAASTSANAKSGVGVTPSPFSRVPTLGRWEGCGNRKGLQSEASLQPGKRAEGHPFSGKPTSRSRPRWGMGDGHSRVGQGGGAEPMGPGRKRSKSRAPGERKRSLWAAGGGPETESGAIRVPGRRETASGVGEGPFGGVKSRS